MTIRAAAFLVASVLLASLAGRAAAADSQSTYSNAVGRICAGSRLFSGRHETGTRAGAIAVSRDIRRTGLHRLRIVDGVAKPPATATLAVRWIGLERQLVELYATTYLRIWYAIERYDTPRQRASLPARLRVLIDLPRPLERKVQQLEERLLVPDCTGGISPNGVPAP
jgi:hypothetical protein